MELADLTLESFVAHIGDRFVADAGEAGSVTLKLIEASPLQSTRPEMAFSVLFEGPLKPILAQRMYDVDLGPLGIHPLFVVPVQETADGRLYEAVFTRFGTHQGPGSDSGGPSDHSIST